MGRLRANIWKEKDRERLRRSEFESVRCLLGALSYIAHARDGLQERLLCTDHGRQRMAMAIGAVRKLADDLLDTVPAGQCKQLLGTMRDYEMRMVPKLASMNQNVIVEKDVAKGLIDAAREKCTDCVEDEKTCRNCSLYKAMEAFMPLQDYKNGMLCPYSTAAWVDE